MDIATKKMWDANAKRYDWLTSGGKTVDSMEKQVFFTNGGL